MTPHKSINEHDDGSDSHSLFMASPENSEDGSGDTKPTIPDNISVVSGLTTGAESLGEEDELQNVKNLASRDTTLIRFWRFVVAACIAAAGTIVSVGCYFYVSELEKQDGRDAFVLFSNTIEDISRFHFKNMFEASRAMSRELTAEALLLNMTFPFCSFPNYEVYAKQARENAGLEVISYAPVVTLEQADAFVNYTVANQDWIEKSRIMGMQLDPELHFDNVSDTYFPPVIYDVNPLAGETFASVGDGPFAPLWHTSPPPQSLIYQLYNFASDPEYETIFGLMEDFRDTLFGNTNFFLWTVVDFITGIDKHQELHDKRHKQGNESVNVVQPHGSLVQPVYKTLDHSDPSKNEIVGYLMGIMAWDAYLIDLLPNGIDGVYVIVENTCGSVYTYRLNGNQAIYLGEGDLHEPSSDADSQRRYIDFDDNYLNPAIPTVPGHCVFSYRVYPSGTFYAAYQTNLPAQLTGIIAAIFIIMGITFFVLLHFVEKRHDKIVGEAAISNAIVASLFPSSVRKRLFADRGALLPEERDGASPVGKTALRKFLTQGDEESLDDGVVLKAKPIADLFPSATILFADIVGFTSWSSQRQPAEVFTLLETLYRSFDAVAKKHRVFKVETIGDCYVAVCGLPEPCKNHAVHMTNFAGKMLSQMSVLREKLVDNLGADTAGLAMRVGLHSGSVTAGVLRGERSRFQLFGDTVNTAARMESNGKRDRIHVSQQTANLLVKAGKKNWLVPRSEKIVAKGKGELQTYWCVFDGAHDLSAPMGLETEEETISEQHTLSESQEDEDPQSPMATLWV